MTPQEFITKWRDVELKPHLERSAAQEHFIDVCRLVGEPTPVEADPTGETFCFEKGAFKEAGGDGWADVWKRHCFAWEYKGRHADLDAAFTQLRQYALALENPPLLIVSDMSRFRIRTNWTNCVSKTYEFAIEDLTDAAVREKLKWALTEPERLRPHETRHALTERAATAFVSVAQALRERGHDPQAVAHFINRLVFCMFAEDVGLLPKDLFTRMLEQARRHPQQFANWAREIFGAMSTGGWVEYKEILWFNGGLFDDNAAISLEKVEIETVRQAAALEWSEVDPSILGTLFERGLDPDKRAQLGAHYTDPDKIMRIVAPTIIRPWLTEWEKEKEEIAATLKRAESARSAPVRTRLRRQAERRKDTFLQRLRSFTVLDPACGSGNFLYIALQAIKDLEHTVQLEAEAFEFQRSFPVVGPANVKGIEINAYAAELARVSIWIGEIQWMRRNGYGWVENPVLKPLNNIECRDAILTPDGDESEWPDSDVIIGNPPFLGNRKLRSELGHEYAEALTRTYTGLVRGKPDLVCYWFAKAGQLMAQGKVERVGLVATNSIRGGTNRLVLDKILEQSTIFDAWADEPWVVEGAAVRVSLICFVQELAGDPVFLNGISETHINRDLTAETFDLTRATSLKCNKGTSFQGDIKRGAFDISGDLAREWLCLPANPNGRPNSDVLRPWVNGMDLTRRPAGKWIIDFGNVMSETEAALYEAPFGYIENNVKPVRKRNRERASRDFWFRHWNPRPAMWNALSDLSRYIATPTVAKHRLFAWLDVRICPDHQLIVIARDDDTTFGILHSRFHEAWSLRLGTWLGKGNDPRYTPTTTFETFPFPEGLSPDVSASKNANDPRAVAIGDAARPLVELRDRWLNPPEWVEWVDEPVPGYPKRPVPRDEGAANELKKRTLTNLYNDRPQWLADAHAALDTAVAAAYGWQNNISKEDALRELLALNLART